MLKGFLIAFAAIILVFSGCSYHPTYTTPTPTMTSSQERQESTLSVTSLPTPDNTNQSGVIPFNDNSIEVIFGGKAWCPGSIESVSAESNTVTLNFSPHPTFRTCDEETNWFTYQIKSFDPDYLLTQKTVELCVHKDCSTLTQLHQ